MAALFSAFAIWASFPCVVPPEKGPGGLHEKSPGAGRSGLEAAYSTYAVRLRVLRWLPASCGTFGRSWLPTPSNRRSLVVDQSTGSAPSRPNRAARATAHVRAPARHGCAPRNGRVGDLA